MAGIIYSAISRTRRVSPPQEVVVVRNPQDLTRDGTPRYEYFRGEEGKRILDLTDFRGVEDLGDRLRILPGTPWRDLMKYSVEIYGLEDLAVGGSVHFDDAGFGFNEFGSIRRRVEVEAVLEGKMYSGQYKGGVISAVIVRKDPRPLSYMKLERSFDFVINRVKMWYSAGIPPFRDITVTRKGDTANLFVSFPLARGELLKDKVDDMTSVRPYSFGTGNYMYRYFGSIKTMDIDTDTFAGAEEVILFVRKDVTKFVLLSNKPLNLSLNFEPFSDTGERDLFSGCILCGKCVNICPHADQRGDKDFSPLGFFVSSVDGNQSNYANCNFCGKCDEVCPVSLNIVDRLKKKAQPKELTLNFSLNLPSRKSIVITPISMGLVNEALKVMQYFHSMGMKLGIVTLNVPLSTLIKGGEINLPSGVEEIYVLTPEESFYLLQSKPRNVTDVLFVFDVLPKEVRNNVISKKVHKTCMYRGNITGDDKCSFAFLEMINGEPSGRSAVNSQVTICPIASKRLGIPSYIEELGNVDIGNVNEALSELQSLLKKITKLFFKI